MEEFGQQPVRQVAYFVSDATAAARQHAALFGSGPFFVVPHIGLTVSRHRGVARPLDHSSAYGQWGAVMIEFVQQHNDAPSVFRDRFPDGGEGFHHVALIVDDLPRSMRRFEAAGHAEALYAEVANGVAFAMMDCVSQYGHFVELYEPTPALTGFYELVRTASEGFDGSDPVRAWQFHQHSVR